MVAKWGRAVAEAGVDAGTGLPLRVVEPRTGIELALVLPGSLLGVQPLSEGLPTHKEVRLAAPLYVGRYEVTQDQWVRIMGANPSDRVGGDLPVERITWQEAVEFCRRTGFRLPRETEWEFACRGGNPALWYGPVDEIAWISAIESVKMIVGDLHPVGRKRPNAFGLYDMLGNVDEWCEDLVDDPYEVRAVRGGSSRSDANGCHAAVRGGGAPAIRMFAVGMRVVRDP